MTPTESRYATDIYHICKDKPVGYIGKQEATVVEVIVESGTKNIHTMYPIILCNNNLYKKRSEAFIKGGKKR